MNHFYGFGRVRISGLFTGGSEPAVCDFNNAKCSVSVANETITKENLSGKILQSKNKKYRFLFSVEIVSLSEDDRSNIMNLCRILSSAEEVFLFPSYCEDISNNVSFSVLQTDDLSVENIDEIIEVGQSFSIGFKSVFAYPQIPLLFVNWQGYGTGDYSSGCYGR